MRAYGRSIVFCLLIALAFGPVRGTANTINNSQLQGTYAFRLAGQDYSSFSVGSTNQIVATGVFSADGNGGIANGTLSYNDGGNVCTGAAIGSGTYALQFDGHGSMTIPVSGGSGSCSLTELQFYLAVAGVKQNILTLNMAANEVCGSAGCATVMPAGGVAIANVTSGLPTGEYGFRLAGMDYANWPTGSTNQFAGNGVFAINISGEITSGSMNYNDGGSWCTVDLTGGSYSGNPDGTGSLTFVSAPAKSNPSGCTATPWLSEAQFMVSRGNAVAGSAPKTLEMASGTFTFCIPHNRHDCATTMTTTLVPVGGEADRQ